MPDAFKSLEWDSDLPVRSAQWTDNARVIALSTVKVTLRDANLYTVLGLSNRSANGFSSPSAAPFAYFNLGPSRMGLSNRTETYALEFQAYDTLGFLFASIIGVKVKKTGW